MSSKRLEVVATNSMQQEAVERSLKQLEAVEKSSKPLEAVEKSSKPLEDLALVSSLPGANSIHYQVRHLLRCLDHHLRRGRPGHRLHQAAGLSFSS